MSDERPRPQFGEYASREEQLARIQSPTPEQLNPTPDRGAASAAGVSATPPSPVDPQVLAANRWRFNTVGTVAFIVYGLMEVILNTPSFLNLWILVNDQLTLLGENLGTQFDPYPASAASATAGYALIGFWLGLWVGAALLSWRRIRARKFALWIPFVAGVIANVAAGIVITALVFNDPVIANQIITAVQGAQP